MTIGSTIRKVKRFKFPQERTSSHSLTVESPTVPGLPKIKYEYKHITKVKAHLRKGRFVRRHARRY